MNRKEGRNIMVLPLDDMEHELSEMIYRLMLSHMERRLRAMLGEKKTKELIDEVAKDTCASMLGKVGADAEFAGFTLANLDEIVNGTVDFSDFLDFKMNGVQGTGS
jgi:hypothetical protein